MHDMGEGVPIRNVLWVFRTLHRTVPKFYSAIFADERSAHGGEYANGYGHDTQKNKGLVKQSQNFGSEINQSNNVYPIFVTNSKICHFCRKTLTYDITYDIWTNNFELRARRIFVVDIYTFGEEAAF